MKWLLAIAIMMVSAIPAAARVLWSDNGNAIVIDQAVMSDLLAKSAPQFQLPLDGKQYLVEIEKVSPPNLGVTSLRGRFAGEEDSFFLLCHTDNGATVAFFQPGDGTAYRLGRAGGRDMVTAVDYEALGSCAAGLDPAALSDVAGIRHRTPVMVSPMSDKAGESADDGSRHDIIIGFTPAAEAVMGGEDFIRAEAQLAVDAANLTYANSDINSELRLVHTMLTDYEEITAWEYADHARYLLAPDDGRMDDMLVMRDRVGADFVSVLIDGRDLVGDVPTCGVAPVMQPEEVNPDFESLAMSVVSVQCATDNWSLAHEVGHNRGCAHNRENVSVDGAYPYAYGRRFVGADDAWYRTVMAYDHFEGGYERIPYFTNPNIDYAGVPTGEPLGLPEEAHNALAHKNTAPACALFRAERTFVQFGWSGSANGLILFPYPGLAEAIANSRTNGTIVIQNSNPDFVGTLAGPRSYVHDGTGGAVLGGN